MKINLRYLMFLIFLYTGIAGAQIVNIPDANFKAKLLEASTTNNIAENQARQHIVIDVNGDGEIQETEAALVYWLDVSNSQIADITGINSFTNLWRFYASNNVITTVNMHDFNNLEYLTYNDNNITSMDLINLSTLYSLDVGNNPLTSLDLSKLPVLSEFMCWNTFSLSYLNLKNGLGSVIYPALGNGGVNSTGLMHVCADDDDVTLIDDYLTTYYNAGYVLVSSYCTFTPGGDYNTITGALTYDADNNGCDAADAHQSFVKVKLNNGTDNDYTFTDAAGNYTFYTQAGTFTTSPQFENDGYFTISPISAQVVFPFVDNSVETENFCISANGVHHDIEVVMVPVTNARPGFDAKYKIVYKNKGNQVLSGTVNCVWDYTILSPTSIVPFPDDMGMGTYRWNFTDLQPFENREIAMTLTVNRPVDSPPVNNGDVLAFTAGTTGSYTDDNPGDNTYTFNQVVVNAQDPNNIICIEGDTEPADAIGDYLHYVINFENTGTAPANFVVVTQDIDPAQFDINTLELLNSSHNVQARVANNRLQFTFQNINLGVADHGNILFKLKSRASLQVGSSVANRASITFDYNDALPTNEASTVFAALSIGDLEKDASVQVYPNPAKDNIIIKADGIIKSIQLYDIQGRILQTGVVNATSSVLDIASRTTGMYFLKVTTDRGVKVEKIIKE